MKLYTEQQLFDICQSVAEKMCANSLPIDVIVEKCQYYGHSKIEIKDENIEELLENDGIDLIRVRVTQLIKFDLTR